MKDEKLRTLIENFALAFYNRLQGASSNLMLGFTERHANVYYKNVYFEIREVSGTIITTGENITHICIDIPRNIIKEGGLQVVWKNGDNRTTDVELRKRACYELAERFVEEVLPKVDFDINKRVYNNNIDKILSVLD